MGKNVLHTSRLFSRESSPPTPIQNLDDRPLQFRDSLSSRRLRNPNELQSTIGEERPRIATELGSRSEQSASG